MFPGWSILPIPMALEKQLESNAVHLRFPETLRSALMPGGRPFGKSNGVQKALLVSSFFCENVFPTIGWCLCQLRLNLGAFIREDPNQRSGKKEKDVTLSQKAVQKWKVHPESGAPCSFQCIALNHPGGSILSLEGMTGTQREIMKQKGWDSAQGALTFLAARRVPCAALASLEPPSRRRVPLLTGERESLLFSKVGAWGDAKAAG